MANNAPPSGWYARSFDHTVWPFAVIVTAHPMGHGNNAIWTSNPQVADDEGTLFAQGFTMPDVAALSAVVATGSPNTILEIYVNDVQLFNGSTTSEEDVVFSPSLLVRNSSNNLLSVHCQATASTPAAVAYGIGYTY